MVSKKSLFWWVKTSNLKLQVIVLILIVITVFARVFPLQMQKQIVNQAIRFKDLHLLLIYCGLYIGAVVLSGVLKYVINILQARIGEETLAKLRKQLYSHILTLPMSFFRRTGAGMVVSSLVSEIASTGDFVGQAIAVPAINLLTLLAFGAYMFYLNPLLAALSLIIYPFALAVVPILQKRFNQTNRERVDITRKLSNSIGEAVSGIHEIHGNASFEIENEKFGHSIDKLFKTRIRLQLFKRGIMFSNNFFQSLGPFILFLVGGYLAINGRFDLGALVAFLSAYEKLYDPWKELMDFYQDYQDTSVRYKRVMEYFDAEPEFAILPVSGKLETLEGKIELQDVSFELAGGVRLLNQINFTLKPGEQLALVGFSGSGKSTLANVIGQIYKNTGGHVLLDGKELQDLTKKDVAANVGIVAQQPFIFDGTIKENLLYSCNAILEKGNGKGKRNLPSLDEMIAAIQQVGVFVDVLRFGLSTVLAHDAKDEQAQKLIRVRGSFYRDYGELLKDYVEFFDPERYLYNSNLVANLTFGSPNREEFALERLPANEHFLKFLEKAHLTTPLLRLGRDLAQQTVDILKSLKGDAFFFQQSPIAAEEFDSYGELVERMEKLKLHQLSKEDELKLLRLALNFIPARHKMVALPEYLQELVLEGRALFMETVNQEFPGAVTFYRRDEYLYSQTILDNILFGTPSTDNPKAMDRINQCVIQLLIEEDLLETIVEIGLNFQVGSKGDRLSGGQRQKIAIARAFLKSPAILIMDEATAALDNASQARIQNLLETKWKGRSTLVSVVHRLDTIKGYDRIAVMKAGKIVEMGPYQELIERKGILYELVYGARPGVKEQ